MKKEYIKPEVEVFDIGGRDAILAVVSGNPDSFDPDMGGNGDGGDYSRDNNRPSNPNLWDNVW